MDTTHNQTPSESDSAPTSDDSAAPGYLARYVGHAHDDAGAGAESADEAATPNTARHWRPTLNRWLLTLNPGRTQDEYAKAVRYFFETPGAPHDLGDITADLLLAYRGSLAMRADRRRRSMPRRQASAARRDALWTTGEPASALPGASAQAGQTGRGATGRAFATPASLRQGPLSPATVNIRLTALRQFLLFAAEQEVLAPTLAGERIRSSLRRLTNERRRPYQILAEEEWGDFLRAALAQREDNPTGSPDQAASPPPATPQPPQQRGPWGKTRAAREQERLRHAKGSTGDAGAPDARESGESEPAPRHDGRTGVRTAQRDHALISLALATGLRAIELSLLDVGDLVSERRRGHTEWWLSLPDEKTKGQRGGRTLPLAPELVNTLLAYIRATGRVWDVPAHRTTPLFLALSRGRSPLAELSASQAVILAQGEPEWRYRRLRPEQIRSVIHRVETQWLALRRTDPSSEDASDAAALAGETRHISPHALRHSAAIALLLGDEASERPPASVEHVRGWLGHFDIRTTQRYLAHIESRDQRRRFAIRPQTSQRTSHAPAAPADDTSAAPAQPSLFDDEQGR